MHFDGLYMKSLYKATCGCVIIYSKGKLIQKEGVHLASRSNNEAKYAALCEGLHAALKLRIQRLMIKGDSMLIVKQVLGGWQAKNRG